MRFRRMAAGSPSAMTTGGAQTAFGNTNFK
jgi:hypothetical protein